MKCDFKENKKKGKGHVVSSQSVRYYLLGEAKIELLKDKTILDTHIANISFSGIGLYSPIPIDNGRKVKIKVSFFDIARKVQSTCIEGNTIWHSKLGDAYLMGIRFDEELNVTKQPVLFKRLMWLKNIND